MRPHHRIRTRIIAVTLAALASYAIGAPASGHAAAAAPVGWISALSTQSASVRWNPVRGAISYDVFINGRRRSAVGARPGIRLITVPATWYGVRVRARLRHGVGPLSDVVPVVTPAALTCTRYAASGGSDASTGSRDAPLATVQRLVNTLRPGESGCLIGSFAEDVTFASSGTQTQPITLRSAPGTRATLTGRVQIAAAASHIVVAGLRLDGRAINGPGAEDLPSPTVNGTDARFLDNDVTNQRTRICFDIGSIRGWGRAQHTILARNRIHDCGKRDAADNGNNHHHGVYVEGATDTRIVDNVIFQNADRGIQLFPDAIGSTIVGNVIDGNGEGIIFSGGDGYASSGNQVVANVVSNSRTRYNIEHYWEDPSHIGTRNVAARNCVGTAHDGPFSLPAVGWRPLANVLGHPAYVDRLGGDFRLASRRGVASCATWMRSRGLPLTPFA